LDQSICSIAKKLDMAEEELVYMAMPKAK